MRNYIIFILFWKAKCNGLKKKNIELDRKVLSELANDHPEVFIKIVEEVKSK
jgi:ribosomal protein L20